MSYFDWVRLVILAAPSLIVIAGGVVLWRSGRMRYVARHDSRSGVSSRQPYVGYGWTS